MKVCQMIAALRIAAATDPSIDDLDVSIECYQGERGVSEGYLKSLRVEEADRFGNKRRLLLVRG